MDREVRSTIKRFTVGGDLEAETNNFIENLIKLEILRQIIIILKMKLQIKKVISSSSNSNSASKK